MTSPSKPDLYERLMAISQEVMEGRHYETAYHILCAAMHYARDLANHQHLLAVEQAAKAQQDWVDTHDPAHRLSTQSVAQRSGVSLYSTLARQAAMQALLVQQEQRRLHQERLPWPGDAGSKV